MWFIVTNFILFILILQLAPCDLMNTHQIQIKLFLSEGLDSSGMVQSVNMQFVTVI